MLENIDRIEVIRGPGALWGPTRSTASSISSPSTPRKPRADCSALAPYDGVPRLRRLPLRRDRKHEHGHYRLYLRLLDRDDAVFERGDRAADDALNARGGGRWDWAWDDDRFTLIANLNRSITGQTFEVTSRRVPLPRFRDDDTRVTGADVLGRWTRAYSGGAELRVQAYYDHWHSTGFELDETRDTLDLEIQYRMAALGRHEFMFGGGFRYYDDRTGGSLTTSSFPPISESACSAPSFRIASRSQRRPHAHPGANSEHNDFTGLEIQPSAPAWTPQRPPHPLGRRFARRAHPSLAEKPPACRRWSFRPHRRALWPIASMIRKISGLRSRLRVRLRRKAPVRSRGLLQPLRKPSAPSNSGCPLSRSTPSRFTSPSHFHARNNHDAETYGVELAADWRPAWLVAPAAHYSSSG